MRRRRRPRSSPARPSVRSATSSTRPVTSCRSRPTSGPSRPPAGCARCPIRSRRWLTGRPDEAGPLAGLPRRRPARVSAIADRLETGGPQGLLDDVTDFARRRPIVFLAAAGGAGFVVGRLARAGRAVQQDRPPIPPTTRPRPAPPSATAGASVDGRPSCRAPTPARRRAARHDGAVTMTHDPGLRPGHPAEATRRVARRAAVGDDERPQHAVPQGGRAGQDGGTRRGQPGRQGRRRCSASPRWPPGWPSSCSRSRLAWLLDQGLNTALSFAIVGVLWAIAAAVLVTAGRRKLAALEDIAADHRNHQGGRRMGESADELRRDIEADPRRAHRHPRRHRRPGQPGPGHRTPQEPDGAGRAVGPRPGDGLGRRRPRRRRRRHRQRRRHREGHAGHGASADPGQPARRRRHRLRRRLPRRRDPAGQRARAAGRRRG